MRRRASVTLARIAVLVNANQPIAEFKNIRVTYDGYQVVVTRHRTEYSKLFAGHTPTSLERAEKYRNKLLKTLPNKRACPIPRRVLSALGLKQPVVGVFRHRSRPHYAVAYNDEHGRRCSRTFSFHVDGDEAGAYRQAVDFRATCLEP